MKKKLILGIPAHTGNLINVTQALNLKQGISNRLDAKLQNTKDALEAANEGQDAINKLESFINAVEAQRNKSITNEQASLLIAMTRIMLLCRYNY